MTYEEACRNIIREYRTKNLFAKQRAEERRRELDEKYPDIAKIDEALSETGLKILRAALDGQNGLERRLEKLKKTMKACFPFVLGYLSRRAIPRITTMFITIALSAQTPDILTTEKCAVV